MNCLSRFFDRSDANLLYLTFVSGQKDYFPLVFIGFLMIIIVLFSYTINLFVKDKRIIYLIAASMLIFAFFTYFASVSIIEKRYNVTFILNFNYCSQIIVNILWDAMHLIKKNTYVAIVWIFIEMRSISFLTRY